MNRAEWWHKPVNSVSRERSRRAASQIQSGSHSDPLSQKSGQKCRAAGWMGQQLRVLATPAEVLSSEPSTHMGSLQPLVTLAPVNLILSSSLCWYQQTYARKYAYKHTYMHKHTHKYTYTHVLTHMHTCPHTHTCRHNKIKIKDVNFKKNSGVYELF